MGQKVLELRTHDGSEPSKVNYYFGRYDRRTDSLRWRPTAPFYGATPGPAFPSFDRGLYPGHGRIKPLDDDQRRAVSRARLPQSGQPGIRRRVSSMARRLGGADSAIRTADQSEIALFWEDGPWGITPPGHFIYIAMQLLQGSRPRLHRACPRVRPDRHDGCATLPSARGTASTITISSAPRAPSRVRAPEFANPDPRVACIPGWRSHIPTPEFPAYTSGHSTFGATAAEMIALILGRDDIAFSGRSPDEVLWPQLEGVTRHWTSLTGMAEENGMSRLYGGVHWAIDHREAMKAGRAIARQAFHSTFPAKA